MKPKCSSGILLLAVLTIAAACADDDDSSVRSYVERVTAILVPVVEAQDASNQASVASADADFSTTSAEEALRLLEDELETSRLALIAHREAYDELGALVPPGECADLHANTLESLRLGERAFLELQQYFELTLRGEDANYLLDSVNELLDETNKVKQEGIALAEQTSCRA